MTLWRHGNEQWATPSVSARKSTLSSVRRSVAEWLSAATLAVLLLAVSAVPASAHTHVFLGFGLPVQPYPYAYASAPPRCSVPYPPRVTYYAAPPVRAWAPGYWAWKVVPWGRRARVWVPARRR
jgi:hypothetical protein